MKGNEKIIENLNFLLEDELTAINQYIVHSEMCANWGYERLHKSIEKRAVEEMKHAEKLIARILFLDGIPVVASLNKLKIGALVENQLKNDLLAEDHTLKIYNEGIHLATKLNDSGTRELLEAILLEEEKHIDWLEAQLSQIKHMGIQNYLADQTS
jgi:bacterioferritin